MMALANGISIWAMAVDLTARARQLRRDMTLEERLLWKHLRANALGVAFRKQQPLGYYIADFVCFEKQLVLELDGGQHATPEARAYDAARTGYLEARGFTVVRFWNREVRSNIEGVLEAIRQKL